jgi:lipoprotein-anchoring transpeptidase ErfK/SrfK
MRRENPRLPKYVAPGPQNPLGPRAMYLGWSEYRIHGTNAPNSIGSAVSSGCFRMHNADAIDLFDRVHIGAPVIVQR